MRKIRFKEGFFFFFLQVYYCVANSDKRQEIVIKCFLVINVNMSENSLM